MPSDKDSLIFIEHANSFAAQNRSKFIFRVLKYYTRCTDYELDFLIKKIYCLSIPTSQNTSEYFLKRYFGLLVLPVYYLFKRKWLWRRQENFNTNFETVDATYFNSRFSYIYDHLSGTKRITPRIKGSMERENVTGTISETVHIRSILLLLIIVPLVIFPLYLFCLRNRINILTAYKSAVSIYARYDGYFKRYPCDNFFTYEDHSNDPGRYIAFRQNCGGKLIVVQNGERGYQPSWSFGMLDYYFVFGEAYAEMVKKLSYHVKDIYPVGCLALNQYYEILKNANDRCIFDILYIDNGSILPPLYGGLSESVARSEEMIFTNLNKFMSKYSDIKVAYQLRNYESDPEQKERILALLNQFFTEEIEILDNTGQGESYLNIKKAKLVITFQSGLGYEAFMMGKKVLYVNYSGHPSESLCDDSRFQIYDESADYRLFESKVEYLLELNLDRVPDFIVKRQFAFNGRVQERIAQKFNDIVAGNI